MPASATPILDFELPIPRRRSRWKQILMGVAVGVVLGVATPYFVHLPSMGLLNNLLLWFGTFFAAIIIHELGHLLSGLIVGFRFQAISIGLIWFGYEYGKLRFRIRRVASISGAASVTIDRVRRVRRRFLFFVVGGPAANLMTGSVAALLMAKFGSQNSIRIVFLSLFAFVSILLSLVNVVPFRAGAFWSDGARILALLRSRDRGRRILASLALGLQYRQGIAPDEIKSTWLRAAASASDGSIDELNGCLRTFLYFSAREEEALAAQYLERCLCLANQAGRTVHDVISLEAAIFTAWFRRDAVNARRWFGALKSFRQLPKLMQTQWEIAIACADSKFEEALKLLESTIASVNKLPATPVREGLLKGFARWAGQIRDRQAAEHSFATAQHSAN